MDLFWIILGLSYLLSFIVKRRLHGAYNKWGSVRNSANITGEATAHLILHSNEMQDVAVRPVKGTLNDHYDPRDKSIQLSETVFGVPSVAACAVAAHEVGHAIQHRRNYWLLSLRTSAAPLANAGARFGIPAALLGLIFGAPILIQIGVIGYVGALAFQFLTLPVEFDASKRAMEELDRLNVLQGNERDGAKRVLRAAAGTYVANVASSAAYMVYLVLLGARWIFGKRAPLPPPKLP